MSFSSPFTRWHCRCSDHSICYVYISAQFGTHFVDIRYLLLLIICALSSQESSTVSSFHPKLNGTITETFVDITYQHFHTWRTFFCVNLWKKLPTCFYNNRCNRFPITCITNTQTLPKPVPARYCV